jgi:hypothetical protein
MTQLILYIALAVLIAAAVVLLLRRPRAGSAARHARPLASLEFFPVHCRYFPQVRHALSCDDAPYLAGRGCPQVYRRWRKAMRRAGCLYLGGLREDFSRLNHLARRVSLYSSQVRIRQEAELFRLNFYFQLLCGMVWFRLMLGRPASDGLEQVVSLVGSLGRRLEQAALSPEFSSGAITP